MAAQSTRKSQPKGQQQAEGQQQAKPEPCKHDLDPAQCAECNGSAKAEQRPDVATPKPDLPVAVASLGSYQITYHKPSITLPSGEVITHPGKWGTESPKTAAAWLRAEAAKHGCRVNVPDPE